MKKIFAIALVLVSAGVPSAGANSPANPETVARWERYEKMLAGLDVKRSRKTFPEAESHLQSSNPDQRVAVLRVLAASQDPGVLPWVIAHVESEDPAVAGEAQLALSRLVETISLKRRDPDHSDRVVLRPLGPGDPDLTGLEIILCGMLLRPDTGSSHAYAASMVGYLGLEGLAGPLETMLQSPHPAARDAAVQALRMLGRKPRLPGGAGGREETAQAFAAAFLANDESVLERLVLPREGIPTTLAPTLVPEGDPGKAHQLLLDSNRAKFRELRAAFGDLTGFTVQSIEAGQAVLSGMYQPHIPSLRNTVILLTRGRALEIRLSLEDMVVYDGVVYLVKID